jgi:hypothetical protein
VPRLAIVIPVLRNLKGLEDTLVSVLENRPAGCQIVVVLDRPYDDPYELAGEVCFVEAPGAGLAASANAGIQASKAPIVHLLTAGVEVSPGWTEAALRHFRDPRVAAVAPLVIERDAAQRVISAGLAYRAGGRLWRIGQAKTPARAAAGESLLCGPDTLAAFYRKSALEAVGGFDDRAGDSVAGADLALALQRAGFRCPLEPDCRTFADPAMALPGSALRRGIETQRLFWRWAAAGGWMRSLAGHAGLLAREVLECLVRPATVCQLAGRVVGSLPIGRDGQRAIAPQIIRPVQFAADRPVARSA